jgi:hypothetical protein
VKSKKRKSEMATITPKWAMIGRFMGGNGGEHGLFAGENVPGR